MSIFIRWRSKKHLKQIREMPCCICGNQATAHHRIGHGDGAMAEKQPDSQSMPLCFDHHTGAKGIHTIGVDRWEEEFGSQWKMLALALAMLKEME